VGTGQGRRSVLKTVATAPFQLVRGGVSLVAGSGDGVASPRADGSAGMADQWCVCAASHITAVWSVHKTGRMCSLQSFAG